MLIVNKHRKDTYSLASYVQEKKKKTWTLKGSWEQRKSLTRNNTDKYKFSNNYKIRKENTGPLLNGEEKRLTNSAKAIVLKIFMTLSRRLAVVRHLSQPVSMTWDCGLCLLQKQVESTCIRYVFSNLLELMSWISSQSTQKGSWWITSTFSFRLNIRKNANC